MTDFSDPIRHGWHRRHFLRALAVGGVATAAGALPRSLLAAPRPLVVVTSYPDEVVARFEAAFEEAYPDYRLQIVWRMPHDALPYLSQPKQSGVDVFWSPSPRTFAQLKNQNAFRKLDIDTSGLPATIGRTQLADADNFYRATEMAGYGFAVNTTVLQKLEVPVPRDWTDLLDPRLAGQIALPSPARVGFAPVMIDIVLQAYGWQRGWAVWSELAAQSLLMERGATFVTDEVGAGKCAIGLSIDFFVNSAIANGAPLQFVYPQRGGINPAHIAIMAGTLNLDGARAFANFVLSPKGQALLTHADIRKLPVRPSAYEQLSTDYYRPFDAAAHGAFDYDNDRGRERLGVVTALFEHCIAYRHDEQAALWRQLRTLEAAGKSAAAAREQLCAMPLTEAAASSADNQKLFRNRVEGAEPTLNPLEANFRAFADQRIAAAQKLLVLA